LSELYAQAAVIPYRFDADGRIEVLLIRKAEKTKWGIPKGLIDPDMSMRDTWLTSIPIHSACRKT